MPKIVSEEERRLTKEAIYEKTIHLIKEKGVRRVTVDDIVHAACIGKGSFYTYYPSKEACLFDVIKRWETHLFSRLEKAMALNYHTDRDKAVSLLREIYTAPDSLVTSISQTDMEVLLRKLPARYREMETETCENNFQKALQLMNLSTHQMEVVALLTDCLGGIARDQSYSQSGKNEAMDILIHTISDFIVQTKK